jgi:DNA-binding transcriptional LysR family regulator
MRDARRHDCDDQTRSPTEHETHGQLSPHRARSQPGGVDSRPLPPSHRRLSRVTGRARSRFAGEFNAVPVASRDPGGREQTVCQAAATSRARGPLSGMTVDALSISGGRVPVSIGDLPAYLVEDQIARGRLVSLLAPYVPVRRALYAIHAASRLMPAKTRAFLKVLETSFQIRKTEDDDDDR